MGGDTTRKLLALAALAVIVAAMAWTLVPFNDLQVRCATAATTALHGEPALLNAAGYPMLTGGEAKAASGGLYPNDVRFHYVVACRGPARVRVGLAGGAIVVAIVGLTIAWQALDRKRSAQLVQ